MCFALARVSNVLPSVTCLAAFAPWFTNCYNELEHKCRPTALQVMAPKQAALTGLSTQAGILPLDSQLLFSSVAALLGAPGQANYSAANSVLDAAAQRAQQAGSTAVSLQWGAWAGAGMAAQDRSTAARLERVGMGLVSIPAGLSTLAVAINSLSSPPCRSRCVLAAVPFRWHQFVAAARKPLPRLFDAHYSAEHAAAPSSLPAASATAAAAVDAVEVQAAVQAAVRSILGADVGASEPLMAAGLDSLGAVELHSSLQQRLGVQLPSTLVFDYPTVAALTEFLSAKLAGQQGASPAASSYAVAIGSALPASLALGSLPAGAASSAVVMLGASWRSPRQALDQLGEVANGVDAIGLVPLDRWNVEADPLAARFGAYLADVAAFDAAAFSTSDAEAALMDPQQRLLLETVGEALLGMAVDAAAAPLRARGVYVGEQAACRWGSRSWH